MKNSQKLAVFAIAAMAAMAAFSAGAATIGGGVGAGADSISSPVLLRITNNTGGCVRVYASGQHDLQARASKLVAVAPNHNYMASVFKGRCGGAAVKNVWVRAPGWAPGLRATQWVIR